MFVSGWDPLCRFLGKPVPSKAFPHLNEAKEFEQRINKMVLTDRLLLLAVMIVIAIFALRMIL